MPFPLGLALLGLAAGGAVLLARGADHEQAPGGTGGGGTAPGGPALPPAAPPPADLTCAAALDVIGSTPGAASLAATISLALAKSMDPAQLEALALQLETAAGSPSTSSDQRAALVRLAQCCRDRATALRVAAALEKPGGKLVESSSGAYLSPAAAADGSPPPTYTAAPVTDTSSPKASPQPQAVVVDSYSAARNSPIFMASRMGGY